MRQIPSMIDLCIRDTERERVREATSRVREKNKEERKSVAESHLEKGGS